MTTIKYLKDNSGLKEVEISKDHPLTDEEKIQLELDRHNFKSPDEKRSYKMILEQQNLEAQKPENQTLKHYGDNPELLNDENRTLTYSIDDTEELKNYTERELAGQELDRKAQELMIMSPREMSYIEAIQIVLRKDSNLARKYIHGQ